MINVEKLSVSFAGKNILEDISFRIERGKTLTLLGRNGSGKSVLLKTVAGLVKDYSGQISIGGSEAVQGPEAGREGHDFQLAYVFQKGGLFDSINVFDNAAFGLRRLGYPEEDVFSRVSSAIERVGLKGAELKLPSELSGGMQKRVGIARAVCMRPSVILYDDPTAGLDPILSDSIADLIKEIRDEYGTTSIVVTNDLKVARKVSDRIALLYSGRFVCNTGCAEFFSESDIYSKQFITGDIEGPIDIL